MENNIQIQLAIEWALKQEIAPDIPVSANNHHCLVDKVREYFNVNEIPYETFSYDDLIPYLPAGE